MGIIRVPCAVGSAGWATITRAMPGKPTREQDNLYLTASGAIVAIDYT